MYNPFNEAISTAISDEALVLQAKKTACTILTGKKTSYLLLGKELCQVVPETRRFCLSTIEMRERL